MHDARRAVVQFVFWLSRMKWLFVTHSPYHSLQARAKADFWTLFLRLAYGAHCAIACSIPLQRVVQEIFE